MTKDREYFSFENPNYGYRGGFRDFPIHFATADIIEGLHPESVLELGGARGYVAKKLIARGIPTIVLEGSKHCYQTRAVNSFILQDIEETPWSWPTAWPIGENKRFDLVFSDSVLEHLHYEKIDEVIKEIARVGDRSLHGVALNDGKITREQWASDATHVIFETKEWWEQKFKELAPDHEVTISGNITVDVKEIRVPGSVMRKDGSALEEKLNIGSFIDMFYYGWHNCDVLDLHEFADHNQYRYLWLDARRHLPFVGGSVDAVFSSHFLEHLTKEECDRFLKECYRIMCPGACIRMAVPDLTKLLMYYQERTIWRFESISPGVEKASYQADKLWELLLAGHFRIFDEENLVGALKDAGFVDVAIKDPFYSSYPCFEKETITSYPDISLVVEGRKGE